MCAAQRNRMRKWNFIFLTFWSMIWGSYISLTTILLVSSVVPSLTISYNITRERILVAIPGMGLHPNRTEIILANLQYLFPFDNYTSTRSNIYELDCIIYVYKTLPKPLEQALAPCTLEYIYHGNYAYYMKALVPQLLEEAGYSYLFVLLDDVRLSVHFNLTQIILTMKSYNLTMATPGVFRASMHSTLPHPKSSPPSARYVRIIEIFATIFTIPKWKCWWNMLQPGLNIAGWGYDLCFSHFCPDSVALEFDRSNVTRMESINSFISSYAVIGSQRLIHEKYLGRLKVNNTGLADLFLTRTPPGHQKNLWLKTLSRKQNHDRPISCLDRERNHQGKYLDVP